MCIFLRVQIQYTFIVLSSKDDLLVTERRNKWQFQRGFEVDLSLLNLDTSLVFSKQINKTNTNSLLHV